MDTVADSQADRLRLGTLLSGPIRGSDLAIVALIFVLTLIFFVVTSPTRRVGDGFEYMAMAQGISELKHPAPPPQRLIALEAAYAELGAGFQITYRNPALVAADGRQEFPHFWMYSAFAAPFVGLANVLGWHPNYGFAALNVALLSLAFVTISRFVSVAIALFVCVSPVLWWLDKAHTEVWTVALLLTAFAALRSHPWWALVAVALASTQNLPIAFGIPVVAFAATVENRELVRDRRFQAALVAAFILALIHPLYYLMRLGAYTSQAVIGGVDPNLPNVAQIAAVIVDPNIGLLANFPLLTLVLVAFVLAPALTGRLSRVPPALISAGVLGAVFLVAFTQTANINSGATPGISRYALWLIPLTLPLLAYAAASWDRTTRFAFVVVVLLSGLVNSLLYRPDVPEDHLHPSWLANELWTKVPAVDNPPRQIFFERMAHAELEHTPIATESCSKVLTITGDWPAECGRPPSMPSFCRGEGSACYANRSESGYDFVPAPPP